MAPGVLFTREAYQAEHCKLQAELGDARQRERYGRVADAGRSDPQRYAVRVSCSNSGAPKRLSTKRLSDN